MALPNKFAAVCSQCRTVVAVGQGTITKTATGWSTRHTECPKHPGPAQASTERFYNAPPSIPYDDDMFSYEFTGMSESDWKDALNPDEGDKG